jgi:hypothetical protein
MMTIMTILLVSAVVGGALLMAPGSMQGRF